ncbi:MAG: putative phosphoesterase [Gammaproteobacteria bacterium]|jgi:putative phosphoesterase
MRIGVIADTHLPSIIRRVDELGPQAGDFLASVDLILHAGDVTAPSVLEWCEQFAPIKVARGNNDLFEHPQMADRHVFDVEGWRIGLVHEVRPESRPIAQLLEDGLGGTPVDILITGDTHVQRLEFREQVLFMNPGSPTLPHHKEVRLGTVGLLEVSADLVRAQIVVLGQTQGSPNPGRPAHLSVRREAQTLREL